AGHLRRQRFGHVASLVRVFAQVEEHGPLALVLYELIVAVEDHPPSVEAGADVLAVAAVFAGQHWAQRAAIHRRQRRTAGVVQERGGEIVERAERVAHHALLHTWAGDDEGDAN